MATAGKASGLVIQALRHLGKRHVDDPLIAILRKRLSAGDRKQLLKDLRYAPAWIAEILRKIGQLETNWPVDAFREFSSRKQGGEANY
jgi:hypothetical protein